MDVVENQHRWRPFAQSTGERVSLSEAGGGGVHHVAWRRIEEIGPAKQFTGRT
jgi:hypothetical protein